MTKILYGLVLAGGMSSRMGRDKATLVYQGQAQLQRAMACLEPYVEKAFVSIRESQRSEPSRASYEQIIDEEGIKGPAAGLLAAYKAFPHANWLVLACDLPLLRDKTLRDLCHQWHDSFEPSRAPIAYRSTYNGLPEPLCAIWTPPLLEALKSYVTEGVFCPRKALIRYGVSTLSPSEQEWLENVNTPSEREAVLKHLGDASI
ncbi:molybdenum cofactor guanylyltransferase [Saccharibacter sp. 17.LH.SD]|uniref:molybdenum cofactor guanylyltransferase n=1 Tax=Saccharibacter sp. 17.LH.SD TaxID=2689393 RepID=UPI00136C4697|nr:molybdenum cofactor guanylyltransferase [Saccharibacter sp. 17.LH.SD]